MSGIKHGSGSKLMGADDCPDSSDEGEERKGPDPKPAKKKKAPPPTGKIKGLK